MRALADVRPRVQVKGRGLLRPRSPKDSPPRFQGCQQHRHITEAGTSAPCLLFQGPSPATHTPPWRPQADARFSNTYLRVTSLWVAAIIATTSIPTVRLGAQLCV